MLAASGGPCAHNPSPVTVKAEPGPVTSAEITCRLTGGEGAGLHHAALKALPTMKKEDKEEKRLPGVQMPTLTLIPVTVWLLASH